MYRRLIAALGLVVVTTSCEARALTDTTPSLPTLLVTNASCSNGGCRTLEIRGFVWSFTLPQQPTGFMVVGEVAPGQHCLVFPPTWIMTVVGVDSSGRTTDSTAMTWTPGNSAGIYLAAVDSTLYHADHFNQAQLDSLSQHIIPFDGFGKASVGSSPTFVPGQATGWSVTFPSTPIGSAILAQRAKCTP